MRKRIIRIKKVAKKFNYEIERLRKIKIAPGKLQEPGA